MSSPIDKMIDASVQCLKCGKPGYLTCDCWEKCTCGWVAEKGKPCNNPATRSCSTRVLYGKYNRKTKRYE
jgi:hypothetical protein